MERPYTPAWWAHIITVSSPPCMQDSATQYDQFLQTLMAPSVMSTVLAWEPYLKLVRAWGA